MQNDLTEVDSMGQGVNGGKDEYDPADKLVEINTLIQGKQKR